MLAPLGHSASDSNDTALVFLHGFLGTPTEWLALLDRLPAAWRPRCHCLTLPGHGADAPAALPWHHLDDWLDGELNRLGLRRVVLYGYSLGGRLALHYAASAQASGKLAGLILESANPGLATAAERQQRARNDAYWVRRLRGEPLRQVLGDWYQQPVFADLSAGQRHELIALRSQHAPRPLAHMLAASSLARQPDLTPWLQHASLPVLYLYGAADHKFATLAESLLQRCPAVEGIRIPDAGHNLHLARPELVAAGLRRWLRPHCPDFNWPDLNFPESEEPVL